MQPWRKLEEREVYSRYRRVVSRRFELPNGRTSDFEVLLNPPIVAVLAVTREGEVVLVREFRPGPEAVLVGLPGGVVDPGEDPLAAAQRELGEETGYAGNFRYVGSHFASAYSTHRMHATLATDCYKAGDTSADPGEHLEVVLMPLADFREYARSGELTDVSTAYRGLDALGLLS